MAVSPEQKVLFPEKVTIGFVNTVKFILSVSVHPFDVTSTLKI